MLIVLAVILSLLLAGSTASAADVTPLKKGERAPFDGQLLPTDRAIRLGQKAERCDIELELNAGRLSRLHDIDIQLERGSHQIDLDRARQREAALKRALTRRFWEHPIFVAAVTAVSTYALLLAAKELP